MITLHHYLILSAALFCIGLYGATSKKNAIAVFMGVELMLNSANINIVAFNHYLKPNVLSGHVFAIFVIAVAAAEVAVGLAIILSLYRHRKSTNVDDIDLLKW
ncbi:NADH-quinone oxidoreductase subunit K [Oxobacter pfennigii]|uniref:NADH-quinone oxidoreductase subunit K n=1 Tax=Oxobacter pfennigii TaxID=36849 RepID=A0A0N8NTY1_9CLOT|nr:NADH-quinone oxidoreductase subunit NuoK [Oxobacter pfennigii]KPU46096.1 NADH-quinone oxidoreductase subunit K [Oxobacter pfennigii]